MKKAFEMPKIVVEQFVPNEYVAACGDSGTMYKFTCDSGDDMIKIFGSSFDGWGDVFLNDENNLTPGVGNFYHPCGQTHEAPTTDTFYRGFFYLNGGNDRKETELLHIPYKKIEVIIWTDGGTNVHCTTELDTSKWEITKS